jgi:retinol-binding protein 3
MKTKFLFKIILTSALFLISCAISAQDKNAESVDTLTNKKKELIIKRVATEFREKYVFEDVGEKMAAFVEQKFYSGGYDSIVDPIIYTAQLENDMRSISNDRHLKIRFGDAPTEFDDESVLRKENFGFKAVEILPGNIGYLSFFQFYDPKYSAATALAAMNFLVNCDALIIDLRENGGGYPELRKLICSYFFDEPVCLIEFRNSRGVLYRDSTVKNVIGRKITKIPIYILVSKATFSCAEDFAFCMQNLKRATIIGENTGGGAHDSKIFSFPSESIWIQVPFNEAVDPVTKKTWEGIGIKPDIEVPYENAKLVAMIEATKTLLKNNNPNSYWKYLWEWVKKDYETQLNPLKIDANILDEYVGQFGYYKITLENCELYIQSKARPKSKLIPIDSDNFKISYQDDRFIFDKRVKFNRDDSGKIIELFIYWKDGDIDEVHKKDFK